MTRARDLAAGTFELATGGVLKLETSDTTVTDGSVLGKIEFKAPDEASGTDAILVGAAIEAVAEGTFAADNNATELVFKTGASAAADVKMILTSGGNVGIGVSPTTSYGNALQIHDTGTSGANLRLTDNTSGSGTGNGFEIIQIGVNNYMLNRENGFIAAYTNNTERMRITNAGNVGIGTSSPDNVGSTTALTINRASGNGQLSLMGNGTVYGRIFADNATGDLKMGNPTSNDVMFYTANTERMRIDATGAVTMPLQPAFQAHKNGTDQTNFAVNAVEVTVTWSHEAFDQNADFDLSNNRFVAPVTGKYQLNLMLRLENIDSASDYYVARITTSNQEYSHLVDPDYGQDNVYYPVQISVLADMDANDTATVKVAQQSATVQTDIDGSREYTSFSGYLVA